MDTTPQSPQRRLDDHKVTTNEPGAGVVIHPDMKTWHRQPQPQQQQQQAVQPSRAERLAGIAEGRHGEITFAAFVAYRETLAEAGSLDRSKHANEMSALSRFCQYLNIPMTGQLVPAFTIGFDDNIRRFETAVAERAGNESALTVASARSYVSRLRSLRTAAEALCSEPLSFAEALDKAIDRWLAEDKGRTVVELCSFCGIGELSLIRKWRRATVPPKPTENNFQRIGRLEVALGMEEGSLRSRVVNRMLGAEKRRVLAAMRDDPETMPSLSRIRLCPKLEDLPVSLRKFFEAIEKHKTGRLAGSNLRGDNL
jgi:hypothetical protein